MAFSIANPAASQQLARNNRKVYEGPMFKQGRYNRSWRSRWFVLYNTRKLAYYADKKESIALKPIAEIDLTRVENIVNDRSRDVQNKFVFELVTNGRTFYLACLDMESLNLWSKYLHEMVFGTQIHVGWLIKKGDRIQSWRKRWFTLSDLRELRYYEDETQKKSKGSIDLSNVSIIRHGDKEQYGYEYTIEIITPDRTWVLVTTYHELRELWMEKLDEAMNGGIKMSLLYQGWLWKFEQNHDQQISDWTKKYYGIDRETLNLYYTQSYNKFKQFASTLFFDKSYYLNAVDTQLQGCLPIQHAIIEQYGNDDSLFDNTSQKSNPWIFCIKNVLGENYFAADNELGMKEWIHHLNWAIGSGPDKVIQHKTAGGDFEPYNNSDDDQLLLQQQQQNQQNQQNQGKKGDFLDDNYLEQQEQKNNGKYMNNQYDKAKPPQNLPKPPPKKQYNDDYKKPPKPHKKSVERQRVQLHQPKNADYILQMVEKQKQEQNNAIKSIPPISNVSDQFGGSAPPPPSQPYPQQENNGGVGYMGGMNGMNNGMNNDINNGLNNFGQNAPIIPMQFKFGPDGMPIMEPEAMPQQIQQQQQESVAAQQQSVSAADKLQFNERELELMTVWTEMMSSYKSSPSRLEAEASFPCNFDDPQQIHQQQLQQQQQGYHYGAMGEMIKNSSQIQQSSEMHENCQCVLRIATLMDYYLHWMATKQSYNHQIKKKSSNAFAPNEKIMGMSFLISILADYSMTELLNDFFHCKRFHSIDVADNLFIEPLTTYFCKFYGACPIKECVSIKRNNLNYLKCRDLKILRVWYYIDSTDLEIIGTSLEWEEIATQQILDMLHCYIYHGAHFSLYDTTSPRELEEIRNIYAQFKQKFNQNRYITNVHPFHHIPYKPMDMETPKGGNYNNNNNNNPLLEGIGNNNNNNNNNGYNTAGGNQGNTKNGKYDDCKYNDREQMYEYTSHSFGIDMEHNTYQRAIKMYGPCKYYDFKQEMLSHSTCNLSITQFNIICLRASILLSTFQGKLLKSRRIHDLASTFSLDPILYSPNDYMTEEMCQALIIYCCCEHLRFSLQSTYFKVLNINETDIDCRRRHYSSFYHFGKLLYTAIIAFGTDIYDDGGNINNHQHIFKNQHRNYKKQKFYYHNVSKPVLFNKFNVSFYGATSCTLSKNIALIHMPIQERDGIVLELDTNNVGWTTPFFLNISIFSNNPSEQEQLFHGGASLGIHNIISVYHHRELSNLSFYTSAITLLRYIIGDTNNGSSSSINDAPSSSSFNQYVDQNQHDDDDSYALEILDEFDQNICKHLEWLIDHQVSIYRNNKNINEFANFSSDVPLYIALVLNSWCLNKQGIIQLNMKLLAKLPKPLQHKFVYESPDNLNDYSINWSVIFNLFPNCNKVWKRGLYFNNYLCEQYVNFLCSEHITNKKYKMDGIVFSCTAETDWKLWVTTAKKHSSIIKQMGWLITASPPKKNAFGAIETGRVSFIKRINKQ